MGEIHNHSRKEARLGRSENKPHGIELMRCMHAACHDGHYAPADHDSGYPFAGTSTFNNDRTRNFKQNVTDKEDAGPKPENAITEA